MTHEFEEMLNAASREAGLCEGCPFFLEPLQRILRLVVAQTEDDARTDGEIEDLYVKGERPDVSDYIKENDKDNEGNLRKGRYETRMLHVRLDLGHIAALGRNNREQPCMGGIRKEMLPRTEREPVVKMTDEERAAYRAHYEQLLGLLSDGTVRHTDLSIQCELEVRFWEDARRKLWDATD